MTTDDPQNPLPDSLLASTVTTRELQERKSVRVFRPEPLSPQVRESILEAAFEAPTAGNQQLYSIIEIKDEKIRQKLALLCDDQPFIDAAPLVLAFVADCRYWPQIYRAAGAEKIRQPGVGDLLLAVDDTLIAAQNAVSAAWSLGVGSCYIGDFMENAEAMRELLHLPSFVFPATLVVFGYPTQKQLERQKPSRSPECAMVMVDSYQDRSPEDLYEIVEARRGSQDFESWAQAFCARKYNSDFSREMTRSVGVYLADFDNSGNGELDLSALG
ncbi:nitroreductase [Muricaecibacterium torontonense]|uniref:Nitroreductase n=1 Tax=Muricaecibacterium torontonense TaxID=3032871 RepID=A0A4S2F2K6_9ACTN|nr:nitroreductase family protein [Muricaecibacterium torontonense]TGY61424.1 nitroreductase [Muricaecibacterium torontonense]